jgi:hypothetical protein
MSTDRSLLFSEVAEAGRTAESCFTALVVVDFSTGNQSL